MAWLVDWWDAVELWLVQLLYPLQVALVMAVLLPLCWAATRVIDYVVGMVGARLTRVRDVKPPLRPDSKGETG